MTQTVSELAREIPAEVMEKYQKFCAESDEPDEYAIKKIDGVWNVVKTWYDGHTRPHYFIAN